MSLCSRPGCLCGGSFVHDNAPTACEKCNGSGRIAYLRGMGACEFCGGVGVRDKRKGKTRDPKKEKPGGKTA